MKAGRGFVAVAACCLSGVLSWSAAPSARTYQTARAVGKRCSTCHTTTRPNITNLNPRGKYYLMHRTLAGYAPPAPDAAKNAQAAQGASRGERVFNSTCALCHGLRGQGTPQGKPLVGSGRRHTTEAQIADVVRNGIKGTTMMSFAKVYSAAEIRDVARYAAQLAAKQ